MASKILLISTNRFALPDPVFPLGLAHLQAALRRVGHEVEWLDCQVARESLESVLTSYRPDFIGVSLRNIDDVNIRKQAVLFEDLVALCGTARRKAACPIILGGSGFSIFPERLLELTGADYGIQGEGESALVALVEVLEQGGDPRRIPGLVYRNGTGIELNPRRSGGLVGALAEEDRPAELIRYYLEKTGMLNMQTQRGCAFACCYCTYPLIEGKSHRRRPPEEVAEEFEHLQKQGARYVCVVDSVFNSTPTHVVETCEAIIRRNLQVKWGCFLRPQGLTAELMKLMARAGLAHVEYGSDSFCDSVLEAYGKGFKFEEVLSASELARQEKIDCCHFLICGGPGETGETLQVGFENSRFLKGAVMLAVVGMRIYPGTPLFGRAVREGVIARDTDLLRPVYYLSPALTEEEVFRRLGEFVRVSPNWIVGDPAPAYTNVVERLRKRGVTGPLWSYFALMQRLLPQGVG